MARVRISRQGFITGKLSLEAQANTEAEVYNFGLDMCENFALKPLGGAYKRSGTQFIQFLVGKYSSQDGLKDNIELTNREYIRFFNFYYKNENVLIFITSGKYVRCGGDENGSLGDPKYGSMFGYVRENGEYGASLIDTEYVNASLNNHFYGYLLFQSRNEIDDISSFSYNNEFYFFVPKCSFEYKKGGDWNKGRDGFIEYSAFLKLSFNDDGSYSITDAFWSSEPLVPEDRGYQLLIGCYCQKRAGRDEKLECGTYPWAGDLEELTLYAQILDKDGLRVNNASIINGRRVNKVDLSYLDGLNIFFKFLKTNINSKDRTDGFADRFPPGVYWIGGKINLINDSLSDERNAQDIYYDFTIELKSKEQAVLFNIINIAEGGVEHSPYPDGVYSFRLWTYSEGYNDIDGYGVNETYPWDGNPTKLKMYFTALGKGGQRLGAAPYEDDGRRFNNYWLPSYGGGLRVDFIFNKKQKNIDDRTQDAADTYELGDHLMAGVFNSNNFSHYGGNLPPRNKPWVCQNLGIDGVVEIIDGGDKDIFNIVLPFPDQTKPYERNVSVGVGNVVGPSNVVAWRNINRTLLNSISDFFYSAFNKVSDNAKLLPGLLKSFPKNIVSYKGRMYIFFDSWIFGSRLGKGATDFSLGTETDYGFTLGWGDGKVGVVNWVIPAAKLIVGTNSGIYYCDTIVKASSDGGRELSPPEMISNIGSNSTYPVLTGNSIVFVGGDNITLYEINLVGENGISVSKINSHCLGIFTENIIRLRYSKEYLWTVGESGQCNVCCFAASGFTRRWFSYSFGGRYARLRDIFVFSDKKMIASFNRHLNCLNIDYSDVVSTIEVIKPLVDVYRDKSYEHFFLDFATAKSAHDSIVDLNNGEIFSYICLDLEKDKKWINFFTLINDSEMVPILFYFLNLENGSFSYWGGADMNSYIFVSPKDLNGSKFRISPFIFNKQSDLEDRSVMGQPILVESKNVVSIPFFDVGIYKYKFFKKIELDGRISQNVEVNFNKKCVVADQYLGIVFGIEELLSAPFVMNKIINISDQVATFNVEARPGGGVLEPFDYESYVNKDERPEFRFYLSPANKQYFALKSIEKESGELATVEIANLELFDEAKAMIDDVEGAKGYNENVYTLSRFFQKKYYIYWKSIRVKYNGSEIPPKLYGGFWSIIGTDGDGREIWGWSSPQIAAFCMENGVYSSVLKTGFVYFYMSYFKFDEIKHLLGETCQITYDGNQGWIESGGKTYTEFVLSKDLFSPLDTDLNGNLALFLPKECVGIYIVIGVPYISELQTVGLEGGCLFGSSEGCVGTSRDASLTVLYSRGGLYGNNPDESGRDLYPLRYDSHSSQGDNEFNENKNLSSASFTTTLLADKNNTVRAMYIRHDSPCNFAVLNIVQDIKVSDG